MVLPERKQEAAVASFPVCWCCDLRFRVSAVIAQRVRQKCRTAGLRRYILVDVEKGRIGALLSGRFLPKCFLPPKNKITKETEVCVPKQVIFLLFT